MLPLTPRTLLAGIAAAGCFCAILLRLATRLSPLSNRTRTSAILDTDATRIGKAVSPLGAAHPGLSGVYPLRDPRGAFAARVVLAHAAERTLDVQYYIWKKDLSGTLLMNALRVAADRGVRVRLLLDDNNTSGLDGELAALDAHPNIEVRLFNPFVVRRPRLLGYLTDFARLNRRMHNKSFTVDNQVTIVGGRNVGDEYFGAAGEVLFADLDVMAVGPVVHDVSRQFDRYWASDSAYPAERILPPASADAASNLVEEAARIEREPAALAYVDAIRSSLFVQDLVNVRLPLHWVATRMVSDDPAKALGRASPDGLVTHDLRTIFGDPATELDIVSPYFVPGSAGTEAFTEWSRRGVKIRVLTNSLEATDVAAVHAGYAKRREALLRGGVALYELKRSSALGGIRVIGKLGSSGASLHAKTFSVDRARVFVGSFNFDPRSARLNTEMGFVIDDPVLARQIEESFSGAVPMNAYEVSLSRSGRMFWTERRDGAVIRHDHEPGAPIWVRAFVSVLSHLPIEWLL